MKGSNVLVTISFILLFPLLAQSEEITYSKQIKALFDSKCVFCHGTDSPEYPEFEKDKEKHKKEVKGPRMDSYTYLLSFIGWPDTGALMRRLDDGKNTKDGKPGNMYQNLGTKEDERQKNLKIFQDWVGKWDLKRWAEVTKEDLEGLKVKY